MPGQSEFAQAAKTKDRPRMIRIAQERVKGARTEAERKQWRKRLGALEAGRELKFSRRKIQEVR